MNGCWLMVAATCRSFTASTGRLLNRCWLAATAEPAWTWTVWPSGLARARELGRDVAGGAGLVLHDHGAAGERAQLFGKIAHQHVGAAAGREAADEADVLGSDSPARARATRRRARRGRTPRRQPPMSTLSVSSPSSLTSVCWASAHRGPLPIFNLRLFLPRGQTQCDRHASCHCWNACSRVLRNCGSTISATTASDIASSTPRSAAR